MAQTCCLKRFSSFSWLGDFSFTFSWFLLNIQVLKWLGEWVSLETSLLPSWKWIPQNNSFDLHKEFWVMLVLSTLSQLIQFITIYLYLRCLDLEGISYITRFCTLTLQMKKSQYKVVNTLHKIFIASHANPCSLYFMPTDPNWIVS